MMAIKGLITKLNILPSSLARCWILLYSVLQSQLLIVL
jgi:hypothetical protein